MLPPFAAPEPSRSTLPVSPRWAIAVVLVLVLVGAPAAGSVDESGRSGSSIPGASPATPPAADPPAAAMGPRTFTVLGSGDVLLHQGLWKQGARDAQTSGRNGYDFDPLLASIKPAVSAADLAICHLETPVGSPEGPFSDFPIFSVPPHITNALANVGYDSCSTASNHAIDRGETGVRRTLDALDSAGLHHAGTARSAPEAATLTLLTVYGVVVGHLAYTFSFNGLRLPYGKDWLANRLDPAKVLAEARRAKRAGAAVVIVSLHWGTEYSHRPNRHQTTLAKRLLASPDVDLILGHHAHVVQPLERIGDKWVAYGMGNLVAYQHLSLPTRDGIMPRFTFTEVSPGEFKVTKAEVLPIHMWLDRRPVRLYDVGTTLADQAIPTAVRVSCRASLRRTAAILDDRGAAADGLVILGVG